MYNFLRKLRKYLLNNELYIKNGMFDRYYTILITRHKIIKPNALYCTHRVNTDEQGHDQVYMIRWSTNIFYILKMICVSSTYFRPDVLCSAYDIDIKHKKYKHYRCSKAFELEELQSVLEELNQNF